MNDNDFNETAELLWISGSIMIVIAVALSLYVVSVTVGHTGVVATVAILAAAIGGAALAGAMNR